MVHPAKFNKSQLQKLLTIEDPQKETVYGIVGRMEILLDFFQKNPSCHGFIPFLITYYYVTKAGAEKYLAKANYFHSVRNYEILDIHFASLYFHPLLLYLTEESYHSPWRTYFRYCERKDGTPFLQVLLGINSHINADLYTSLVDLQYHTQHDFFLVNDILQEVTPDVMQYLAFKKHDIVGITGLLFKDLLTIEFHSVVERWRSEAWVRAQLTTLRNKKRMHEKVLRKTEIVGERLISAFSNLYQLQNTPNVLHEINTLSLQV